MKLHLCLALGLAGYGRTLATASLTAADWRPLETLSSDNGVTWTLVNLSNVYSSSYQNPHVHAANPVSVPDELACRAVCAAQPTCNSYTWWPAAHPGDECSYIHQCYWRDDTVWHLKDSAKCAAVSGYKGTPPNPPPGPPNPGPPTPPPPPSPPAPPGALNVLFVIFDDLRIIHDAWGFEQAHTPNTNALAAKSLVFDRAYCNQAVCGPSRASLLSGRRPDTTQMWNFVGGFRQTPGAETWNTWPEWFKKHGYYTAGCGKLFHPGDPQNFDPPSWTGDEYGGYFGQDSCPKSVNTNGSHGCPVPPSVEHKFPDLETLAVAKTQLGMAKNGSTPFWIGVGFVKPHMPHVFPEKYLAMVPPKEQIVLAKNQLPPNGTGSSLDWYSGAESPAKDIDTPAPTETQQDWRQNYYAAAAFSDDVLGELLAEVDSLGFTDNTIVIFTADHGWGLGEHNHWVKYTNFETDARVPLMVHHPKFPHTWGTRTPSLIEHVDHYPTIAELAGVPVTAAAHETIEGFSYASLFTSGANPATTVWMNMYNASFTQYPRCGSAPEHPGGPPTFSGAKRCANVVKAKFAYMGYSMRTTEWRYTEWALWNGTSLKPEWTLRPTAPDALVELYNHAGDTGNNGPPMWDDFENANLAGANPEVVTELSGRLRAFFATYQSRVGTPYAGW